MLASAFSMAVTGTNCICDWSFLREPAVFYANNFVLDIRGGVGRKLRLLSELLRNSRDLSGNINQFEQALRAAFEPAEGVAEDRLRAVARGRLPPPF